MMLIIDLENKFVFGIARAKDIKEIGLLNASQEYQK